MADKRSPTLELLRLVSARLEVLFAAVTALRGSTKEQSAAVLIRLSRIERRLVRFERPSKLRARRG